MSKQLTKLIEINLYKITKTQLDDGDFTNSLENIGTYKVAKQELTDAVSATIYGANLSKMLRISSIHKLLEVLMKSKMNNSDDNVSKYQIKLDNEYYKIVDVKSKYLDIERL